MQGARPSPHLGLCRPRGSCVCRRVGSAPGHRGASVREPLSLRRRLFLDPGVLAWSVCVSLCRSPAGVDGAASCPAVRWQARPAPPFPRSSAFPRAWSSACCFMKKNRATVVIRIAVGVFQMDPGRTDVLATLVFQPRSERSSARVSDSRSLRAP